MKYLILIGLFTLAFNGYAQKKKAPDSVRVVFTNGETAKFKSFDLRSKLFASTTFVLENKTKIDPKLVRSYENKDGYYLRATVDSSRTANFYRRDIKGKLSVYSSTSYTSFYTPNYSGAGPSHMWKSGVVSREYLQKDTSTNLLMLTPKNLRKMTWDDKDCRRPLGQIRTYRRLTAASMITGPLLFFGGFLSGVPTQDEPAETGKFFNPVTLTGAALFLAAPIYLRHKQMKKKNEVIRLYNQE
jgi:hypothetical protein